ncbi:MAG: serine/threonine protein kinase [Deltaproteobacteria bacterium]|nr:serine/threonine protein kinase [Deltaproteobacteria bacterium]
MGEVYVATRADAAGRVQRVALKKLHAEVTQDPLTVARFKHEARLMMGMSHRNLVEVYRVGEVEGEYYLEMELVQGRSMEQLLARCRRWRKEQLLPLGGALYMVREVLAALEYCHQYRDERGLPLELVHRDVNPSNVLVSYSGEVKLTDFGLATSTYRPDVTESGMIVGRLGYVAPERWDQKPVDPRTDVYGVGVILFELITCQRFAIGTDPRTVRSWLPARCNLAPSELRPSVPGEVDDVVLRALHLDPERRFRSAREFRAAVQHILQRQYPTFDVDHLRRTAVGRPREEVRLSAVA